MACLGVHEQTCAKALHCSLPSIKAIHFSQEPTVKDRNRGNNVSGKLKYKLGLPSKWVG